MGLPASAVRVADLVQQAIADSVGEDKPAALGIGLAAVFGNQPSGDQRIDNLPECCTGYPSPLDDVVGCEFDPVREHVIQDRQKPDLLHPARWRFRLDRIVNNHFQGDGGKTRCGDVVKSWTGHSYALRLSR